MITAMDSGDFCVVGTGVGVVVAIEGNVRSVITGAGVAGDERSGSRDGN